VQQCRQSLGQRLLPIFECIKRKSCQQLTPTHGGHPLQEIWNIGQHAKCVAQIYKNISRPPTYEGHINGLLAGNKCQTSWRRQRQLQRQLELRLVSGISNLRSASNFWLSCGTVGLAAIVAMAMEQQHPGWQLLLHVADATLQLQQQHCCKNRSQCGALSRKTHTHI